MADNEIKTLSKEAKLAYKFIVEKAKKSLGLEVRIDCYVPLAEISTLNKLLKKECGGELEIFSGQLMLFGNSHAQSNIQRAAEKLIRVIERKLPRRSVEKHHRITLGRRHTGGFIHQGVEAEVGQHLFNGNWKVDSIKIQRNRNSDEYDIYLSR